MSADFLITFREGLEAALIIAIVLAYLRSLGRTDQFKYVFLGAISAIIISLIVAIGVFVSIGKLEGRAEQLTEGSVSLLAAGVLTWMIFWMRSQSMTVGKDLRSNVDAALTKGTLVAMASVVFIGVLREGIETALFLIAVFINNTTVFAGIGSLVGLVGAASIGALVYKGSSFIKIKLFFQITGGLIILIAAGLLSNGIHEFQESGIINIYLSRAWDLTWFPPLSDGQLAEFLKSIVGWRPNPSVGQAVAWVTYLTAATWFFYFAGLTTKTVKRSKP